MYSMLLPRKSLRRKWMKTRLSANLTANSVLNNGGRWRNSAVSMAVRRLPRSTLDESGKTGRLKAVQCCEFCEPNKCAAVDGADLVSGKIAEMPRVITQINHPTIEPTKRLVRWAMHCLPATSDCSRPGHCRSAHGCAKEMRCNTSF